MGSADRLIVCTLILFVGSAATGRTQGRREARTDARWELGISDADPQQAHDLGSLAVGDLDKDGHREIVTA